MTRKTIPFRIPQKPVPGAETPARATAAPAQDAVADQWVHQSETASDVQAAHAASAEAGRAPALTITISTEPNWFDVWKIMFLPYAVFSCWALGAARKGAEGFPH